MRPLHAWIDGVWCRLEWSERGLRRIRMNAPGARRGGPRLRRVPRLDLSWATPFQRRVLARLARVRRGTTITYGALARALGSSARAVGRAVGANRLPLLFP